MNPGLSQTSDQDLAALARAGRDDAYRELLSRYKAPVYRLIVKHIGDPDEALDLTQETFLAGFSALSRYDGDRPFRIWIARIAINKCRDWRRRQRVRQLFIFSAATSDDEIEQVPDDAPSAHASAASKMELEKLSTAIAALPSSLREVLLLRTVEGLNQSEAALALSISGKAVETRLYRARVRLAEILADI